MVVWPDSLPNIANDSQRSRQELNAGGEHIATALLSMCVKTATILWRHHSATEMTRQVTQWQFYAR